MIFDLKIVSMNIFNEYFYPEKWIHTNHGSIKPLDRSFHSESKSINTYIVFDWLVQNTYFLKFK